MRFLTAAALCLLTVGCFAESRNPADYPLRVHVFLLSQTTFYQHRMLEEARGDGRANLFEGNDVHGIDFNYDCESRLERSIGFETYPARWEKPGRKLVLLLPVVGKAGAWWTCELNTDVKDFVYFRGRNGMGSVPEQKYLRWMARHNYDPVHGDNAPSQPTPQNAAVPATPHY
jgi:hypothetical protein